MSEFEKAVEEAKLFDHPPDSADMLSLYGLHKQATEGDVNTDDPGSANPQEKMKWDAWICYNGLSKEEARAAYVDLVDKLNTNCNCN